MRPTAPDGVTRASLAVVTDDRRPVAAHPDPSRWLRRPELDGSAVRGLRGDHRDVRRRHHADGRRPPAGLGVHDQRGQRADRGAAVHPGRGSVRRRPSPARPGHRTGPGQPGRRAVGRFSRSAVAAGARAVFGFPIAVGDVRLGALNLYRDRPGPLTADQHADALVVADVAARSIIAMQAGAAPGQLGGELEAGGNFRFVVHQAAGMVAVQLGVPRRRGAGPAARPRLQPATTRLVDVAEDVIARRLRFDPDDRRRRRG